MAGLITVKRLRKLLADPELDDKVAILGKGDAIFIGKSSDELTHIVDFFGEELKEKKVGSFFKPNLHKDWDKNEPKVVTPTNNKPEIKAPVESVPPKSFADAAERVKEAVAQGKKLKAEQPPQAAPQAFKSPNKGQNEMTKDDLMIMQGLANVRSQDPSRSEGFEGISDETVEELDG